jgi:signal transduction histidine kinase
VSETLEHLAYLARGKNIKLRTDFPEKVIPIECDPDIIALVVANLINNAIKYTQPGGEIMISLKQTSAGLAEFSVKDSGIGIAKEDLAAIFSGFYRTEQGRKSASGTGLGLKISRDFVEAHGSSLKAESEPGRGTRFFFSLPISGSRT